MGFLDNLVSDLVKSSTGINARGFVRMVGGKNILLLGGAAADQDRDIDVLGELAHLVGSGGLPGLKTGHDQCLCAFCFRVVGLFRNAPVGNDKMTAVFNIDVAKEFDVISAQGMAIAGQV